LFRAAIFSLRASRSFPKLTHLSVSSSSCSCVGAGLPLRSISKALLLSAFSFKSSSSFSNETILLSFALSLASKSSAALVDAFKVAISLFRAAILHFSLSRSSPKSIHLSVSSSSCSCVGAGLPLRSTSKALLLSTFSFKSKSSVSNDAIRSSLDLSLASKSSTAWFLSLRKDSICFVSLSSVACFSNLAFFKSSFNRSTSNSSDPALANSAFLNCRLSSSTRSSCRSFSSFMSSRRLCRLAIFRASNLLVVTPSFIDFISSFFSFSFALRSANSASWSIIWAANISLSCCSLSLSSKVSLTTFLQLSSSVVKFLIVFSLAWIVCSKLEIAASLSFSFSSFSFLIIRCVWSDTARRPAKSAISCVVCVVHNCSLARSSSCDMAAAFLFARDNSADMVRSLPFSDSTSLFWASLVAFSEDNLLSDDVLVSNCNCNRVTSFFNAAILLSCLLDVATNEEMLLSRSSSLDRYSLSTMDFSSSRMETWRFNLDSSRSGSSSHSGSMAIPNDLLLFNGLLLFFSTVDCNASKSVFSFTAYSSFANTSFFKSPMMSSLSWIAPFNFASAATICSS